ncbi:MAG: glucokinase [Rhodospirillales bacterium]|nr:glucokinase [Rhodospirillales bacterium]
MIMVGLIADIGGTNARFALANEAGYYDVQVLQCDDYPTIVEAARAYLEKVAPEEMPTVGSFAIAGPVTGDWFEVTNNHWKFSVEETRKELGLQSLHLMNDFKAIALAVPHIGEEHLKTVADGVAQEKAPIAILGPGTGLGVASLVWGERRYIPVPGEGGHITMPAKTQREFDLFRTLRYKYHHISAERVCSGKGLVNLYQAILRLDGHENLPERTAEEISKAAINKECVVCEEALDKMCKFLGSVAGNHALMIGAFGGVYIAGGIPEKLGEYFFQSGFYEAFFSKGRYEEYLKSIPIFLITHPFTAMVGLHADLFPSGEFKARVG